MDVPLRHSRARSLLYRDDIDSWVSRTRQVEGLSFTCQIPFLNIDANAAVNVDVRTVALKTHLTFRDTQRRFLSYFDVIGVIALYDKQFPIIWGIF